MALVSADFQSETIGTITFNNDRKRNALSGDFIHELMKALNDMIYHPVRVVILRANPGAAIWSAGHDISELPRHGRDPLAYNDPLEQAIRAIQRLATLALSRATALGRAGLLSCTGLFRRFFGNDQRHVDQMFA